MAENKHFEGDFFPADALRVLGALEGKTGAEMMVDLLQEEKEMFDARGGKR